MKTFKTIEEIFEHNRNVLANNPIIKARAEMERATNREGLSYFERATHNSQPHKYFKLDWNSYSSIGFADTFLPHVQAYQAKALRMYDGGDFFKDIRKSERKVLAFNDTTRLHTVVSYTYPKGVLAEERKGTVQVAEHEICTFIEFDPSKNIDVTFKFGSNFYDALNALYKNKKIKQSAQTLERGTYRTTT